MHVDTIQFGIRIVTKNDIIICVFFLIGFLFASGKWFCVFFLCFFCPSCVPRFLAASSPKSDVFFMKTLPALQMMSKPSLQDQLAGWPAQLNCNNKCCSNGPATIWNRRWWNNKWLVLQVWFVVPSGFRLASACLGTASGNELEIFRVHVSLQKCL